MNREIKFRALKENPKEYVGGWNGDSQDNAKWVYGSGIVPVYENTYPTNRIEMVVDVNYDELDYWQPSYSNCKIIPSTVCQYIGKEDINKKEIYEGDIVRNFLCIDDHGDKLYEQGVVKYDEEALGFSVFDNENNRLNISFMGNIEVIGNIFENLDLTQE